MSTYRVDRNTSKVTVPAGMNSLLYCGDSLQRAKRIFANATPHYDAWNKYDRRYGITLSRYDLAKRDFIVQQSKGLP